MKLPGDKMDEFIEAWKELDREASTYIETKNLRKLLFMKSEESVTPSGWPNLVNQKQSAVSSSKIVHFQSSPGQHKTAQ